MGDYKWGYNPSCKRLKTMGLLLLSVHLQKGHQIQIALREDPTANSYPKRRAKEGIVGLIGALRFGDIGETIRTCLRGLLGPSWLGAIRT